MDSIQKLELNNFEKKYFEQSKCFNLCVNAFTANTLNPVQKKCLKQCFSKMASAQKIFLDRLKQTMEFLVVSDPELQKSFSQSKKS